jgi:hypothetical protein
MLPTAKGENFLPAIQYLLIAQYNCHNTTTYDLLLGKLFKLKAKPLYGTFTPGYIHDCRHI